MQVLSGVIIAAVGFGVGEVVQRLLGLETPTGFLTGLVLCLLGLQAYRPLFARIAMAGFRRNAAARGLPQVFDVEVETSAEGIRISLGHYTIMAGWPGVTGLIRSGDYWVVLADYQPLYVPRRWFAGADEERAFVGEVLERIPPGARGRSPEAVKAAA